LKKFVLVGSCNYLFIFAVIGIGITTQSFVYKN
jgi:hypothetical protein